jgi:3-phenylpropionate/trans-cinnamate dioxygenase ferredoxin reductase subunit
MTSPETYALVVVGSGPAGVSAAASYVDAGGPGPVLLVSADVDPPYQRPPLSKDVLAGESPAEPQPILDDEDALEQVELRLGVEVAELDPGSRRLRGDGLDVAYERLVLATGSEPAPFPDAEQDADVHYLRSLGHGRELARAAESAGTAVVIGSGFIGCEAAASLARRGVRTALVTPEEKPLEARVGSWAGERIAEWLRELGVDLHLGQEVERIDAPRTVRLSDGSALTPDLVLVAVGVSQERDFLVRTDLEVEEGRLVVDTRLRAGAPGVWAAGDVAHAHHGVVDRALSVEHWGDALSMGQLAGRNAAADAAGGEQDTWDSPPGFWSTIGTRTLKYSAWGDGHDDERVVEDDSGFTVWYSDDQGELVGVLTHEHDDDYERGGDLLGRRATLAAAVAGTR